METPEGDEQYEQYKNEQDTINESDTFAEDYGFEHECRCAEDWAEGNLGVVSVCYLDMTKNAMDTLRTERTMHKACRAELAQTKIELADS